jgi:hypothetical protein
VSYEAIVNAYRHHHKNRRSNQANKIEGFKLGHYPADRKRLQTIQTVGIPLWVFPWLPRYSRNKNGKGKLLPKPKSK